MRDNMDNLNPDNSTTTFRVENPLDRFKKFAVVIILAAVILGGIVLWARISSGARSALNTARDIRVTMKLISLEYYGEENPFYDPSSADGMASDAPDRIKSICPYSGDLTLYTWDEENSIPLSFTYRDGRYLVEYKEIGHGDGSYGMNGDWTVYYDFKIMEYKAG